MMLLAHPILNNAQQFYQQHPKLVAPGLPSSSDFGSSVSLSSDASTAIIGAWGGTTGAAGQAIIYNRNGSSWIQGQTLLGTGTIGGANQGASVAISGDGNTAVIGGPSDNSNAGAVWIFVKNGNTWTQQAKLVGTGATGNALQGFSVAISDNGSTVVVGAPLDNSNYGAFWIFSRSGNIWTQTGGKYVATGAIGGPGKQGSSVGISGDGNTIAVGAMFDGYGNNGAVYIFTKSGGSWNQDGKFNTNAADNVGTSVALSYDGTTIVAGAARGSDYVGGAYVLQKSVGTWTVDNNSQIIRGTGAIGYAQEGGSVDISADGNTIVIGGGASTFSNFATLGVGDTWVFKRNSGSSIWNQEGKYQGTGNVGNSQQGCGVSMAADGNTFVTGGPGDNNYTGAIWVFSTTIPTTVPFLATQDVSIYPNPANKFVNISASKPVLVELYSIDGRVLISKIASQRLDISSFPSGMYLLNIYDESGTKIKTEKIIKSAQ